jgi:amino acid adenylation domain-containing protein
MEEMTSLIVKSYPSAHTYDYSMNKKYHNDIIHHLFELQVEQTPDSIALVFEETALTYKMLNARANQVASYLQNWNTGSHESVDVVDIDRKCASEQKYAVGPETIVGLFLERSIEMIVGVLGILKAGGAFMPLDPAYPQERLAYMVQDAQISILLTHQGLLNRLPAQNAAVLCMDTQWETITQGSTVNRPNETGSDNLAYVIYTSGSTGKPKGVLVPHRGVCNLAREQISIFDVAPGSRVLQFASFSFDAFVSEIFMALLSGATLHMVPQDSLIPGPDLFQLFLEQAITHVTLPPSILAVFPPTVQLALQTLIVAGEVCPDDVARRWIDRTRFFNAYGPTEGTVCATCAQYTIDTQKFTTIGLPIANVEIYLLDAYLQPVPTGTAGELYIGGIGLAYGYLNRADLSAKRFIPHPFSSCAGERLYQTGDLAAYQSDGSLVFLGRTDRQVKLRGFRIEPEEIEAVLNNHPAVQQSSLVLQEDASGDKRLAAFVVPAQKENDNHIKQTELWPSVAEYFIYDELLYFAMTHDERRNASYKAAINRTVKDKIVVDIGTGKDAILARFCVEGGAKRVYALEILEDVYEQAKACIQGLGLAEKIHIIHGDSTTIQLPELVDVCVSEIVGSIGGSEGATYLLNDARRFLKPGGIMVPELSTTKIAAFSLPSDLSADPGFTTQTASYVKKVFEQVGYPFDLRLCLKNLSPDDLVSSTGIFEELDFTHYIEPNYCQEMVLTVHKQARIDGFLVWLNLQTIEGEEIDILQEEFCWLPVYLPVFYPGVEVTEGDSINITCSGTLSDNHLNPDYRVNGCIMRKNGETIPFDYTSFHHQQLFKENAFYQEVFLDDAIKVQKYETPPGLSVDDLRSFLKNRLPTYMLPATFITVDTLPLMPNGKVDLHMLSRYEEAYEQPSATYVPPQTVAEQTLVKIWQEVLDLEKVGIHDNFFDLGGHSLLLGRVHDDLLSTLNKEVSIIDLFTYPTISSLITYINQGAEDQEENFQHSYDRAGTRRASSVQRQRQTKRKATHDQPGDQDE